MTWKYDILEVASMLVTWWIVDFCTVDGIVFPGIFIHNTVQPVNENCSRPTRSLLIQVVS